MISVLVIDDHQLVRNGLKKILESSGDIEVVGEGASGEEAIELARQYKPDVVLMDVNMPGIGGINAAKQIRRNQPNTQIIVVTAMSQEAFSYSLQEVGVLGFLSKSSNPEEMIESVHTVVGGDIYMSRDVAQQLALAKHPGGGGSKMSELSDRELQVLLMITKGMRVQEISESLFLSPKTISTYRQRIQEKLGVNNDIELTYWALRHNIIELH
ncbi:MAG: response regulator [Gammaproteobacteria bacterium]|jgi:two-component system, NarL family, invasion response regulator UvrY